ncbi:MAG: hypothetical protein LKE41_07820 [Prevotella sp.]|jgi:hypothetical protein|nr:hypothetical protein [Prevotella sp.]MCI2080489.1 hypothetical protein [Prevotella sp.]MCI2102313.1 hypothetical protein [Prevotella sp.]
MSQIIRLEDGRLFRIKQLNKRVVEWSSNGGGCWTRAGEAPVELVDLMDSPHPFPDFPHALGALGIDDRVYASYNGGGCWTYM